MGNIIERIEHPTEHQHINLMDGLQKRIVNAIIYNIAIDGQTSNHKTLSTTNLILLTKKEIHNHGIYLYRA